MARPLRVEYPGCCYHVMGRGNGGAALFRADRDGAFFPHVLGEGMERYDVLLHAYSLMDTHYHLCVRTQKANLQRFMHYINSCYSGMFKARYGWKGHVFGGRYKALAVQEGGYLLSVITYIHLNPVRTKTWEKKSPAERYERAVNEPWSSLREYVVYRPKRGEPTISAQTIYGELGAGTQKAGRRRYRQHVHGWLEEEASYRRKGGNPQESEEFNPLRSVKRQAYLGDEEFGDRLESLLLQGKPVSSEIVGHLEWRPFPRPSAVLREGARLLGVEEEAVRRRRRAIDDRPVLMYLVREFSRATNNEIGELFGVGGGAVSKVTSAIATSLRDDRRLRRRVAKLRTSLIRYFQT